MTSLGLLPIEAQLLFLAGFGVEDEAYLQKLLGRSIDWDLMLSLAEREGAAPALSEMLRVHSAPEMAGTEGQSRLHAFARVISFKMGYLEQRIAETVDALYGGGVEAVLLKGAALGSTVYKTLAERPMIDLDILVKPANAKAALRILLGAGWLWRADRAQNESFEHLHHLPALLDARGMQVSLELHTDALPVGNPFELSADRLLSEAVPAPRLAPGGRVPSVNHQLLHLCIHFAWSHLLRKGAWKAFQDLRRILDAHTIDWPCVVREAQQARAATCCYWTLRLAASLGRVSVPLHAIEPLAPPLPESMLAMLERHFALVLLPTATQCPSVRLRRAMWSLAISPRRSGHRGIRPWTLLTLGPEAAAARAAVAAEEAIVQGTGERRWLPYWRSMILPVRSDRLAN